METRKRSGSERVQPDSGHYLAIERACQSAFSSHPQGKSQPALRFVEALDRATSPLFALLLAQHSVGTCHGLASSGSWA